MLFEYTVRYIVSKSGEQRHLSIYVLAEDWHSACDDGKEGADKIPTVYRWTILDAICLQHGKKQVWEAVCEIEAEKNAV